MLSPELRHSVGERAWAKYDLEMDREAIVFYVTGHGFGHARRSGEVIRELVARRSNLTVHVKTTAPAELFADLPAERVMLHRSQLDPGAIEKDALTIDWDRTAAAVGKVLGEKGKIIAEEAEFVRRCGAKLIVADVPFLAGDVAEAAGISCVACSNFTWDWIYEPVFAAKQGQADMLREIRAGYRKMETILKQPFGGDVSSFREVIEVPLVVRPPRTGRLEVMRRLGIEPTEKRPIILVGIRGGTSAHAIERAGRESPELIYLYPQTVASVVPPNVNQVKLGSELSFADLLAASDVVISKLGYGIVADCIAHQKALIWPPRHGFREDQVMRQELGKWARHYEMPLEDFREGRWGAHIAASLEMCHPEGLMRADGAAVCAAWLDRRLG